MSFSFSSRVTFLIVCRLFFVSNENDFMMRYSLNTYRVLYLEIVDFSVHLYGIIY